LAAGEPLPSPYKTFEKNRMLFRRGTVCEIAGPPGTMKTQLMLNIVDKMGPTVPTLYFSSDSDDFTMASRVLAMKTGETMETTEQWTKTNVENAQRVLKAFEHVKWSFDPGPSLDHLEQEADAYAEVRGEYPHHIIIDVLMDIDVEGAGDQQYWGVMFELKALARKWMACITVIHHTSEGTKGDPCPPRSSIMGKANQLPALILTLAKEPDELLVACVKNRFGNDDTTGRTFVRLDAKGDTCQITDPAPEKLTDWYGRGAQAYKAAVDLFGGDDHGREVRGPAA
jgi:hypothetical protein